jgi:hypothetical protein
MDGSLGEVRKGGVRIVRAWLGQDRGAFATLLAYVVVLSVADAMTSDDQIRLAPLSALAPIAAGALLSLRKTATICALYLALTGLVYGMHPGVSTPNQVTIICSAIAVCVVSLVVCWVRLEREERIQRLRLTAGAAQRLLLRALPIPAGDALVDGFYVAAEQEALVGGDLYEVLSTPYGTRIVIGDVMGKGLPAIGASAAVLTAFREAAYREPDLHTIVRSMEEALLRHERGKRSSEVEEQFVTALVLETMGPSALRAIDCGHVSPFILSAGEVVEVRLDDPGLPLGLADLARVPRRWQDIKAPVGGRMLMCTDGVVEARNARGEYYPLAERLQQWLHLPTSQLLEHLQADLTRHAGGHLDDDAAVLVIQR